MKKWIHRAHHFKILVAIIMIMATFSFLPLEYRPFHHQIIITHQTVKTKIAPSKQFLFLAFYYPWYVAGDKFWSQYGQDLRPLLGHYGSDQISVAERHIEMAVRGGIDSFVVTWTKRNSPRASNFLNATLKASNVDKIKFVMLYESLGALAGGGDFANGALDTFVEDMVFFKDTYFDHPSYLHINGRPVVYVYLTRYWKNFDTTMLHTINNKVGRNILIIADNPYFGNNISPHTSPYGIRDNSSVFEVYNSYNMYTFPNVRLGESAVDYMFRDALPIYQSWSKETVFFPSVLPKYHDFREGHKPLVGDVAGLMQQLQVFACLPRPVWYQNEFPNLMFITSFNEWWEGTSIEPDGEDKYGYKFLDAIKLFKDSEVVCQENQTNVSTLVLKA